MEIKKNLEGNKLEITLVGRLDTTTAPELEEALSGALDNVNELVYDFTDLEYISSAGLRVLLANQKFMSKQGEMKITNANSSIMEVFEVTGFSNILTIE